MFSTLITFALANLLYFALHIEGTGAFPKPLNSKDEMEYFDKLANGDNDAKNTLIEHNLRLVAHVAKKYYSKTNDQEDLISIGTIGLIKAVNTFSYDRATRFATYAARCIENEILMHFRNMKKSAGEISMNEPMDSDSEGNSVSMMDMLQSDFCIEDNVFLKIQIERLYKCVDKLGKREKEIIILRYGLNGVRPMPQREIAKNLDISRSYVSRIEKKALEKLKLSFERN